MSYSQNMKNKKIIMQTDKLHMAIQIILEEV